MIAKMMMVGLGPVVGWCGVIAQCAPEPATQPAAVEICQADAEGKVWQFYTDDDFGCDVVAGQELWLTGTPAAECPDMGGEFYRYEDIDPDDGWDDSEYGDCGPVDF